MMTLKELSKSLKANLNTDSFSVRNGVFTVRRGFFYTHGRNTADFLKEIIAAVGYTFNDAYVVKVVDKGEIWKPVINGAPIARQSHWFVKFTLEPNQSR